MPARLRFRVVDVFSRHAFGGNPLAVFLDAPALDSAVMAAIARQLNLSETVFVRPPSDPSHLASFRIFTPTTELPIAGHPTIGATAVTLSQQSATAWPSAVTVELPVGAIEMRIEQRDDATHLVWMAQGVPTESTAPVERPDLVYRAVGLHVDDRPDHLDVAVLSVGVPILIVPVADEATLDRASPFGLTSYFAAHPPARVVYLVSTTSTRGDFSSRMFGAVAVGIEEDPATGVAAGPLAAYLHRAGLLARDHEAVVNQGHAMGRSSHLHIRTDGRHAFVGGQVMDVGDGELDLEPCAM
jgi:trans-2,3-dihydro-3-hydroxyanthranilate isomerase